MCSCRRRRCRLRLHHQLTCSHGQGAVLCATARIWAEFLFSLHLWLDAWQVPMQTWPRSVHIVGPRNRGLQPCRLVPKSAPPLLHLMCTAVHRLPQARQQVCIERTWSASLGQRVAHPELGAMPPATYWQARGGQCMHSIPHLRVCVGGSWLRLHNKISGPPQMRESRPKLCPWDSRILRRREHAWWHQTFTAGRWVVPPQCTGYCPALQPPRRNKPNRL